jgi:hypothetical protein
MRIVGATLAFVLAGGIVYGAASACSPIDDSIWRGFLGSPLVEQTVPRNVAIVEDRWASTMPELLDEERNPIALSQVDGMPWWRPTELLEPGARVSADWQEAIVVDVIDDAPPSMPGLVSARIETEPAGEGGCRWEAPCGGSTYLRLGIVPSEDDYTPTHQLAYAVFGGASAEEAESAAQPITLLAARTDAVLMSSPLAEAWIAIAAVDRAGNMSERSDAVQVDR